jgi:tRNA/tmRNA/rRNA uracil-C5-methylase (TrmA/RlmC/RlmD family)
MNRFLLLLVLCLIAAFSAWLLQSNKEKIVETKQEAVTTAPEVLVAPAYEYRTASPDGIGKFYLGREISHVMGHPAIGWLERDEREREEAPSRAIDALDLQPTDVIADIGAGSGYYSFRISSKVPQGSVIAVDIQQEMLDFLKNTPKTSN